MSLAELETTTALSIWHERVVEAAFPKGFTEMAKRLVEQGRTIEATVTRVISSAAMKYGGKLLGLNNNIKTVESLTEKLQKIGRQHNCDAEHAAQIINDVLRYTVGFPPVRYASGVLAVVESLETYGYVPRSGRLENYWVRSDTPYHGINSTMNTPYGLPFELQFHTDDSFRIKQVNHAAYKEYHREKDPKKRKALWDFMVGQWDGIWMPHEVNRIGIPVVHEFSERAAGWGAPGFYGKCEARGCGRKDILRRYEDAYLCGYCFKRKVKERMFPDQPFDEPDRFHLYDKQKRSDVFLDHTTTTHLHQPREDYFVKARDIEDIETILFRHVLTEDESTVEMWDHSSKSWKDAPELVAHLVMGEPGAQKLDADLEDLTPAESDLFQSEV